MLSTGTKNLVGMGLKAGARHAVKNVKSLSALGGAINPISAVAVVGIELGRDLKKAKEQLRDGEISQQECINIVLERGC